MLNSIQVPFPNSAPKPFCLSVNFSLKLLLLILLFGWQPARAQITFANFEEARQVLGQPNFTSQITQVDNIHTPGATAVAISGTGVLAVSSQSAGRVMIWSTTPAANGQPADVVIGKPTFTSTAYTTATAASMRDCEGVAFSPDGRKLIVSDGQNNRVLIWNSIPTTNGQPADVVIGQTNFTETTAGTTANKLYYPAGVTVSPAGHLIINEVLNNRVLIFNSIPTTNGASADVIIGQPGINSNSSGDAANQLDNPWYSTVSPNGKLLISDSNNHRILVYNTLPTANGAAADLVIGQSGFNVVPGSGLSNNKFNFPLGLAVSNTGQLAVADFRNNRVLVFNAIPTANGAAAEVVLGQPNFTSNTEYNGGISARSLATPTGVQFDFNGRLFVSERRGQSASQSGRVLAFGAPAGTTQADLSVSSGAAMALPCRDITLRYVVNTLNNGPNFASNVVLGISVPAELTLGTGFPHVSLGTYNAAAGTWVIPTLNPGQQASLIFEGTVSPNFSGRVIRQNAVVRSSTQTDPNLGNNASGTELTVIGNTPPAPEANSVTICINNDTTLTATGPATLRWFNAATNGTLVGEGNTLNTGNLTATTVYYVESYNGCVSSPRTPVTVTVNSLLGNNTISGGHTVCQYQQPANLPGSTPTGGNGSYMYQWQVSTDNVTWFNFGDARGLQKDLNPGGLGQTTYFRRRVIAGPCAHSFSNVVTILVNPLPSVSYSGLPNKICTDTPRLTLTGTPAGGTFAGPGITGNIFDPAAAGAGAHNISYTFTNGNNCTNTANQLVLVGPTVYAGGFQSICVDGPAFALTGFSPAGGTWSGPGVTPGGTFNPATAGAGTKVLTYSVSGNFGCGNDPQTLSGTKSIQVNPLPVITPGPAQTVCIDAPDFYLAGFSPGGGTWTGPGVNSEGLFRPRTAGTGTHTLTYTYNNGCLNSATRMLTVTALPVVTLAAFANACSSTFSPVALSGGSPAGGTYTGTGVTNNRFNPSTAGVGTHNITYTYQDANGCTASATRAIMVEICTGVADALMEKTLAVYPNPAQTSLVVQFQMPAPGSLRVKLLTVSGQVTREKLYSRVSGLYAGNLDLRDLPKGLYILQILTDKVVVNKRVVVN